MKHNRLAALDIGTNSIRCIVVEVDKLGKFKVLDDEKATVRLGEGIVKDGAISRAAWQRAMEALVRMKKIVDGYGVMGVEAVATKRRTAGCETVTPLSRPLPIRSACRFRSSAAKRKRNWPP